MYTVDIDTGGTMTDALVTDGERQFSFKTDTTPHDFTVSFVNCLDAAAQGLEYDSTHAFLKDVSIIRWSSTITTNVLGERRGSRVGLLVTAGQEEALYGKGRSEIVGDLIEPDNVIGMSADPDAKEILDSVKKLLENSVRRVCVSRQDAFPDNSVELRIKHLIEDQYPDHYLGSVPVLLGSEMAQIGHDQTRAHYSVMNAYTHTQLANSLFKAEDLLRDRFGYERPLFIGHTSGGVARVGKTKSVDTIESGPVFGTFGGAFVAREYGIDNAVCFDVGGTTSKVSIIRNGEPVFQRGGRLMGVPVQTSFAMLRSMAIGGGSIAAVDNGRVTLGPESMGAAPGPACYDLGGKSATLTDAILVLGYLDPKGFLGGRRELDVDKAREAIRHTVAEPLGVSVEAAAIAIRQRAADDLAALVRDTLAEAGLGVEGTAMLTFGGNGPTLGCFVAEAVGMTDVYAFDLGPVFSAFGSAISDVKHEFERGVGEKLQGGNREAFMAVVKDLYTQADRDLRGEGLDPGKAVFTAELEFGEHEDVAGAVRFDTAAQPASDWLEKAIQATKRSDIDADRWPVLLVRLTVTYSLGERRLALAGSKTDESASESRSMLFGDAEPASLPVRRWETMGEGSRADGPLVINGATLTCPVPPGWSVGVDGYGNAHLAKA